MTERNSLLRVLGLTFGLAAVVGSIVGQGILRSPGIVAQASGSEAVLMLLWVFGGVLALVSALPFAELGAALPNAGGPVAWAERAFGRLVGVASAMAILILYLSTTALLSFVVGEFLVRLGVGGRRVGAPGLGFAVLVLFCLINSAGTRVGGGAQIALSTIKGLTLIGLVIVLFAQPGTAEPVAAVRPSGNWVAFGTAMLVIIGTYNGWADLVMYGEEIENPGRDIPRAMFGGLAGVIALYVLVNLALFHVLDPAAMARSEFVAADAVGKVFGSRADTAFTAFGALSVAAIANLGVMTNCRLVFAMARDGMLPRKLSSVSRLGTPLWALLASSACASLFLISGSYLTLSSTSVALSQAMLVCAAAAALWLRSREPELPRPWRAPLQPASLWLALTLNLAVLAVLIVQDPWNALLGFALVAILTAATLRFGSKPLAAPLLVE